MTPPSSKQQRIADITRRLLDARRTNTRVSLADLLPADLDEAYAVQDLVAQSMGPLGGWKVGAKGLDLEPNCAPLPAAGIFAAPAALQDGAWRARGIETELAFRFDADLPERVTPYTRDEVLGAIGAALPAIEVVESRLIEFPNPQPLAMRSDLNSHGALITGSTIEFRPQLLDATRLAARQWFDDREVANKVGGNPAIEIGRLLVWLVNHLAARGLGLQAGQIVSTGSFTGMLFAPAACRVRGEIVGVGVCEVGFEAGAA